MNNKNKIKNKIEIKTILPVYFSLTTVPSRIERTKRIIKDILENVHGFERLFLNIPTTYKNTKYGQLSSRDLFALTELETKYPSRFKINRSSIDYGPITKILPVLQRNLIPKESILLIFDDNCYHYDAFKLIAEKQDKNLSKTFTYYSYEFKNVRVPQGVDIISFYVPYLDDFVNYVQRALQTKHCFFVDDLVIAKYLQNKGIPIEDVQRRWTWPWIPDCYNIPDKSSLFSQTGEFSRNNSMHYCYKSLNKLDF